MKINDFLDWILRITGMLALLKIIFNKTPWDDSIKMKRVDDPEEYEKIYNIVFCYDENKEETTIIELTETGFNGNVNHEKGIQFKYSFLSRIYSLVLN